MNIVRLLQRLQSRTNEQVSRPIRKETASTTLNIRPVPTRPKSDEVLKIEQVLIDAGYPVETEDQSGFKVTYWDGHRRIIWRGRGDRDGVLPEMAKCLRENGYQCRISRQSSGYATITFPN